MVCQHKTLFLQNKGFVDINPVEFGYEHCRPFKDGGYDELGHYLIHYVISGKGEFHKNDKDYIVKSGEAFIIKRGETAWYRADEQCPWYYVWIGFEGILAERFSSLNDVFAVPNNIFYKMLRVFERDKMQEEYLISQMFQLYMVLFGKQETENYVDKIKHYIDVHFKQPIKITDIAKEMNMDRKYLAKLFKRESGITMKGYLVKRKMEYAADLLLRGFSVSEVSEMLSYSEQSVFSNAFYRYWNEYPVQFKESQINKKKSREEKIKMKKRIFTTVMAAAITVTALSGCGGDGNDGKLTVKLGYLPQQETQPEQYENYMGYIEKYENEHPDVHLVPDYTSLEADQIMANAAAGQLPNVYRVPFTDATLMIKAGYAKDITDIMKKRGYDTALNEDLLALVKDDEGKLYGVPYNGYMMGMWYNVNLFEQAGLVNDDGSLKYPKTFDELVTTAQTITEKTGASGFGFQTMDAECGWNFMNIAWNYGVKFMEQNEDGSYTATFDSPEMRNAFQYIHDLKWKYKVLPDNTLIDRSELQKLFATDRCAMSIIGEDWLDGPVTNYNMDKNKIATSAIPAGPAGHYAETGGDIWLISKETTDEQAEAIFDWFELLGYAPTLSDVAKENITADIKARAADDKIIVTPSFSVWNSPERKAEMEALHEPHINVDTKLQRGFMTDDIQLHAEEPAQTQQLYSLLASVIQEILTNENADIPSLVSQAQKTFQKDFLDKN